MSRPDVPASCGAAARSPRATRGSSTTAAPRAPLTPPTGGRSSRAVGLLYHWYGVGKGRPAGAPGVIAQLSVQHADGSRALVVTDGTWRVARAPWLPATQRNEEGDPVDYTEHIDGAAAPIGWD